MKPYSCSKNKSLITFLLLILRFTSAWIALESAIDFADLSPLFPFKKEHRAGAMLTPWCLVNDAKKSYQRNSALSQGENAAGVHCLASHRLQSWCSTMVFLWQCAINAHATELGTELASSAQERIFQSCAKPSSESGI